MNSVKLYLGSPGLTHPDMNLRADGTYCGDIGFSGDMEEE